MKFVIKGPLPGLNEYIEAERSNRYAASAMKKQVQHAIAQVCRAQHPKAHFKNPVRMHYLWVEKDMRRDCDNIAFAKKFIQDAFVKAGILIDDSRRYITGFTDEFAVDRKNPRVEIEMEELP
jgi:Holliday junction resolvase RusA-like endonuclease